MKKMMFAVVGAVLSCMVASAAPTSSAGCGSEQLNAIGMSVMCQGVTFSHLTFTETLDVLHDLGVKEIEAYRGQKVGGGFPDKSDFMTCNTEAIEPDRIFEIQIKDMVGGRYMPLGIGEGNVAGMLRELNKQNFKGPLLIEYFGEPENKIPHLRESLDYVYRVAYWMNKNEK